MNLTQTDLRLLDMLRQDGRRTSSDIAAALGVSRQTIDNRIRKLKKQGIIKRFTIDINTTTAKYPCGVRAQFDIRLRRPVCELIFRFVRNWPEVVSCYSIAGAVDMKIMVEAPSQLEVERLRDRLARHPEVATLTTFMVLKTWTEKISGVREVAPEGYRIIKINSKTADA